MPSILHRHARGCPKVNDNHIPMTLGEEEYQGGVITAMHDAIVRRKGGSRFDTTGRKIKPMGTDYAAQLAGWSIKATNNSLDVMQDTCWPSFRAFLRWVYHGIDISVLRAMLRPRRVAVFELPEVGEDADLSQAAMKVSEEMGDVFRKLAMARAKQSPGGSRVTPSEIQSLINEAEDVVAASAALLDALQTRRRA